MNEKIIAMANTVYKLVNADFKLGVNTKDEKKLVDQMIDILVAMAPEEELVKRRSMILGKLAKLQERIEAVE